jgi:agmatine deiminase
MSSYVQPAEWEKHESVWLAWPSHAELWEDGLKPAQDEFTALCRAIADVDPKTGLARGEKLEVLIPFPKAMADAKAALTGLPVRFHEIPFGDIWLRDTAPIFVRSGSTRAAIQFGFNSWGGKYDLPHDPEVSERIARASELKTSRFPFILEGGSIEVDGEGTGLTSRQCLLNPNRNSGLSQKDLEAKLQTSLGLEKVLWFGDGLLNDHTDGHIDTIARFSAPGEILLMKASSPSDPNAKILEQLIEEARNMTDARGRRLKVHLIPSPGEVRDEDGQIMPASYLNFYISNTRVIVPVYGTPQDQAAVAAIARHFPGRETIGLSAKAILNGGGAFHCISQQLPAEVVL